MLPSTVFCINIKQYDVISFPALDLIPICHGEYNPVHLAIVIDDTSQDRFDESRDIAQEILNTLNGVGSSILTVTLVSSGMSVELTANG